MRITRTLLNSFLVVALFATGTTFASTCASGGSSSLKIGGAAIIGNNVLLSVTNPTPSKTIGYVTVTVATRGNNGPLIQTQTFPTSLPGGESQNFSIMFAQLEEVIEVIICNKPDGVVESSDPVANVQNKL